MKKITQLFSYALMVASSVSAQESTPQNTISVPQEVIYGIAFSPDGRMLAAGSPGKARLWDATTGKKTFTLDRTGLVYFVTFSPSTRLLALSVADGDSGKIELWDTALGKTVRSVETFQIHSCASFGADGKTLLWTDDTVLDEDGKSRTHAHQTVVKQWDIATDRNVPVCTICKEDDPYRIVMYETPSGFRTRSEGVRRDVVAWAFSPDGKTVAARDGNGVVEIWCIGTCTKKITVSENAHLGSFSMAFSPDGKTLALARGRRRLFSNSEEDTTITLREVATGKIIASLRGHNAVVSSVAFSPDGTLLASSGHEPFVRLWNVATLQNVANMDTGSEAVHQVIFSPDGATLASVDADANIKLWNVATDSEGRSTRVTVPTRR